MKKLLIAFAAIWLTACSQIDTGNIGVESTLGQVKKETMRSLRLVLSMCIAWFSPVKRCVELLQLFCF